MVEVFLRLWIFFFFFFFFFFCKPPSGRRPFTVRGHQCSLPDGNLEWEKLEKSSMFGQFLGSHMLLPHLVTMPILIFWCGPTAVKPNSFDAESPGVSGECFIKARGHLLGEKRGIAWTFFARKNSSEKIISILFLHLRVNLWDFDLEGWLMCFSWQMA